LTFAAVFALSGWIWHLKGATALEATALATFALDLLLQESALLNALAPTSKVLRVALA
jgi:hypothetical protein